ncbi:hypothetical protein KPATCC21470_7098 [Kitasatospora purpeofusca]
MATGRRPDGGPTAARRRSGSGPTAGRVRVDGKSGAFQWRSTAATGRERPRASPPRALSGPDKPRESSDGDFIPETFTSPRRAVGGGSNAPVHALPGEVSSTVPEPSTAPSPHGASAGASGARSSPRSGRRVA